MSVEQHIKLPEGSIEKTTTTLNLGPTHPATHGVFQNILELDGERIVTAEQTVGYIHRAFEKLAERRPLYQITTLDGPAELLFVADQQYGLASDLREAAGGEDAEAGGLSADYYYGAGADLGSPDL